MKLSMGGKHRTALMLSAIPVHSLGSLDTQSVCYLLVLPNTAYHHLLETFQALVNYHHTDVTRPILFAWLQVAKVC